MISHESMVRLQAEKHELIKTEEFHSEEELKQADIVGKELNGLIKSLSSQKTKD